MDKLEKNSFWVKEPNKRLYIVLFHLWEVLKWQTYIDRNQINGFLTLGGILYKGAWQNLLIWWRCSISWDSGNYVDVYMCQNLTATQSNVYILLYINYTSIKMIKVWLFDLMKLNLLVQ